MPLANDEKRALKQALATSPSRIGENICDQIDGADFNTVTFSGTTGLNEIQIPDNTADALSVEISGGNDFLIFDTTDSNEKLKILSATSQKLGFFGTTPVVQQAAMTAAHAAIAQAGTDSGDVAIQAATNSSPFGFVNAAEFEAVVGSLRNAMARLAEVEAILEAYGLCAAN